MGFEFMGLSSNPGLHSYYEILDELFGLSKSASSLYKVSEILTFRELPISFFCQCLLHVFWGSVVKCAYLYNCYILLNCWPFYYKASVPETPRIPSRTCCSRHRKPITEMMSIAKKKALIGCCSGGDGSSVSNPSP